MNSKITDKTIELGRLILKFGRINRITFHEDGVTPESDTDHTVMLAVIACAIACEYRKDLNLGLVAQFALVHDLVEIHAGDTPNIGGRMIGDNNYDEIKKDKEKQEHEALIIIEHDFSETFPWLPSIIKKYETLDTSEARYVKTLDKAMPKITHFLNNAKVLKMNGYTKESAGVIFQEQIEKLEKSYAKDQKEVIELLRLLAEKIVAKF